MMATESKKGVVCWKCGANGPGKFRVVYRRAGVNRNVRRVECKGCKTRFFTSETAQRHA